MAAGFLSIRLHTSSAFSGPILLAQALLNRLRMLERSRRFLSGRTGRSAFCLSEAALAAGYFVLGAALGPAAAIVALFPVLLAALAIAARRVRDQGRSPRRLLLLLIPVAGLFWVGAELIFRSGEPRRRSVGRAGLQLASAALLVLVGAIAFCSFTTRLRERSQPVASAPNSGRFVRAADAEVFLQEVGPADGAPLLLLHGTGAWGELWRETITFLSGQGYRTFAIDVPPFGYSEKILGPDAYRTDRQARRIAEVLDALNLRKATIIAHSVGSRAAVEVALAAPERVRALVLIDPALGFAARREGEPARFQQNDPTTLERALFAVRPVRDALLGVTATNPLLTRKLFEGFVSRREAVTAEQVAVLQRPLSVEGTTRSYGDWFENLMVASDSSRSSDFANFRTLTMPVLLIWGDADTVTPLWQGEELKNLIPGSTLHRIEGAGHIPHLESPAAVQRALGDFLNTTLRGQN